MSLLKPGTRCVIVAGCRENIGLVVQVIEHLGAIEGTQDAYFIRTVTGRPFQQLRHGGDLLRNMSNEAITERYKLRSLVDPKVEVQQLQIEEVIS